MSGKQPAKNEKLTAKCVDKLAKHVICLAKCIADVAKYGFFPAKCGDKLAKSDLCMAMCFERTTGVDEIKNPAFGVKRRIFICRYSVGGVLSSGLAVPILFTTLLKVNCSFFSLSSL